MRKTATVLRAVHRQGITTITDLWGINMIKNVAIVSLSSGILGEDYLEHERKIGLKRLADFGLNVIFAPNSQKGLDYLKNHPEERAADLLWAYKNPEVDMILCAIGGDDTYRLLPYLFDHDELKNAVTDKVFLGFSDTTINHFMLHKVGAKTFYGQAFLPDICELAPAMLPYTQKYFEELIHTGTISEITPSDVWYNTRESFGPDQVGVAMPAHPNDGYELLQGAPSFSGEILGGCIDTIFDIFDGTRYADMPDMCAKYGLFPSLEDWSGKVLLLESSEEKPSPEKYRKALTYLKEYGIFDVVAGVLIGKPMDNAYYEEYKTALKEVIDNPDLPILCNFNIGHAMPRCILPFGKKITVDAISQRIICER